MVLGSGPNLPTWQLACSEYPHCKLHCAMLMQAVDRAELRHLVNVVVFPARGHRPHPNECSGSDLDGDQVRSFLATAVNLLSCPAIAAFSL